MYGYAEYLDITPEQVLQKVSQEKIFEYILQQPFSFDLRYTSPTRNDKRPNCRFTEREDGTILFLDFGDRFGKTHRTCFSLLAEKENISIETAIKIICGHFKLSTNSTDYSPIITNSFVSSIDDGSDTEILYERKDYDRYDITFWSQFLIKTNELREDNVFSTSKFRIKNSKKNVVINVFRHCYVIDFKDKKKIYQPYSSKYKWISNCDENVIGNFDNLPPSGDRLIIQKSYKDHRVLRNLIPTLNVIWFQNEGCVPDLEILTNLLSRFRQIVIFYDNDFKGIQAAYKLTCILNNIRKDSTIMKYLPIRCEWKDPAKYVSKEGRRDTIKILNKLGL